MKKLLTLYICIVVPIFLNATISVQHKSTSVIQFNPELVWALNIQFDGKFACNTQATASVQQQNGTEIMRINSNNFDLQPGLNTLDNSIIGIKQVQYLFQGYEQIIQNTGTLPAGNYTICYTFDCTDANCSNNGPNALFTEFSICQTINVIGTTNLQLVFPSNSSVNTNLQPQFSWFGSGSNNQYTFTLVQANKDQSCEEAMINNRPIYLAQNLEQNQLLFPTDIEPLEVNAKYCWRVQNMVLDIPISESEVWEYNTTPPPPLPPPIDTGYVIYHNLKDWGNKTSTVKQFFGLLINEKNRNGTVILKYIHAATKDLVKVDNFNLKYGQNRLKISVNEGFNFNEVYYIAIEKANAKTAYFYFKIQNP